MRFTRVTQNERSRGFHLAIVTERRLLRTRDNTTHAHDCPCRAETHILWKIRAEKAKHAGGGGEVCYELYIYMCISAGGRSIRYFEDRIADRFKSYFIIVVCSAARMPRNKNVTGGCGMYAARFSRDT